MSTPLYLNIGCGTAKLPGFVNIDREPGADLTCDVTQGLPYENGSVDGIYSEHFIEHLSQTEIIRFLRECRRVLKCGGRVRIATPDLDQLARLYCENDWHNQPWLTQYGYEWIQTRAEYLNVCMREWGHQWLLNEEELDRLAFWAGLDSLERCSMGQSGDAKLCGLETRPESLLIKEYVKPASPLADEPLVSIIIPAFRPDFLTECLESACNQTYRKLEILVLDDRGGKLEAVVAPHCQADSRVRYHVNTPSLGEPDNLTRGIQMAQGDLIKPLYDDDLLEPEAVDRLLQALRARPEATLAVGRRHLIDKAGWLQDATVLGPPLAEASGSLAGETVIGQILSMGINQLGEPTCMLFRRQDALAIREPNVMTMFGRLCFGVGDVCLAMHLLARGDLAYVAENLSRFRQHEGQTQRQIDCKSLGEESWQYLQKQGIRLGLATKPVRLPDEEQKRLKQQLAERDGQIVAFDALVKEKEARMADLENKLTNKDEILQKVLSNFYRIIPMNFKTRPSMITDKISVIIPVKNSGEQLGGLLQKIKSQRKVQDVEIIIIDSESTDNSVEIARGFGAKIISISQGEFNHGATRNLGAKEAKGDYLVFTVQDAVPINDYYLYNMICPFIEYPELSAISSRQFVKPEADLFSIWMGESLIKSFNLEGDTMYSLSDAPKEISLEFFDSVTKRRLTFFDNVSSCVRKGVFKEIQFAPLINAEDIDYGVKLIERKKTLGYLSSTGVYHWHERGADYVFKRHYIGTKANVYVLKNELQYFFDINNINWQYLAANLLGIYELISISISEIGEVNPEPIKAVQSFINALQKNMDTLPDKIEKTSKLDSRLHGNDGLEAFSGEDGGLGLLLREIVDDDAVFILKQKYNFKQNFLIPDFMKRLENFAGYLCSKQHTLNGREKDFISCIYKILAMAAGDALGAYYLEAETLNRLTPALKRIDRLLGKGVCYF